MAWPRGAIRARRTWALGLALCCLALRARAQAEHHENLIVNYTADGACPDRTEFERRVRARLSAATPRARSMRFDVRLERTAGGVRGTLQLAGQPTGARELSAASCAEAADALALVAALMLGDPASAKPTSETARDQGRETTRTPKRSEARTSQPAASAQSASRADESPSGPSAPASTEGENIVAAASPESDPNSHSAASAVSTQLPASASDHASTLARPRGPFFSDWHIRAWVSGMLAWGRASQLRAGPSGMVSISARAHGTGPRYGLGLGARGAFAHEVRIPEGKAKLRWATLATSLCVEGPERRFSVSGCALIETGWLEGSSRDGLTPRQRSRFWGAVGPALALNALFHPRVGVRLGGELLGVLVRDRFFLADRLLYSVPRLAFRAELGLYFTVW